MGYRRYPGYPRCPHCGHALPIDDFYRQVGARRVPSFWLPSSPESPRFRKDPITGEEVPSQFAISCTRCGTKSAVDTWPGDKIQLALLAGLALLLVLMILVLRARGGTSFAVFVCVVAYVGAALIPLKIAAVITSRMLRVTPISGPIAGWDNESRTDRLARCRSRHGCGNRTTWTRLPGSRSETFGAGPRRCRRPNRRRGTWPLRPRHRSVPSTSVRRSKSSNGRKSCVRRAAK